MPKTASPYSADGGPLVRDGRLNLAPEVAERMGIPANIEKWRFEIGAGAANPEAYQEALRHSDKANLHSSLSMLNEVAVMARLYPGAIVPLDLDEALHDILDDLRARIHSEAAGRGVMLITETCAQVQQ
jgi:hypothetical protein